ncbi:MAG: hypothetical protein AABN33_27900 [Acidobacteriota bacterium]
MSTKEIKKILIDRDLNIAGLAREFGCTRQELSWCIHQGRAYPRLREKLAARLGISVGHLFGRPSRRKAA